MSDLDDLDTVDNDNDRPDIVEESEDVNDAFDADHHEPVPGSDEDIIETAQCLLEDIMDEIRHGQCGFMEGYALWSEIGTALDSRNINELRILIANGYPWVVRERQAGGTAGPGCGEPAPVDHAQADFLTPPASSFADQLNKDPALVDHIKTRPLRELLNMSLALSTIVHKLPDKAANLLKEIALSYSNWGVMCVRTLALCGYSRAEIDETMPALLPSEQGILEIMSLPTPDTFVAGKPESITLPLHDPALNEHIAKRSERQIIRQMLVGSAAAHQLSKDETTRLLEIAQFCNGWGALCVRAMALCGYSTDDINLYIGMLSPQFRVVDDILGLPIPPAAMTTEKTSKVDGKEGAAPTQEVQNEQ